MLAFKQLQEYFLTAVVNRLLSLVQPALRVQRVLIQRFTEGKFKKQN